MKKPDQVYIHMALTRHWNDNPKDRDIPFLGLSDYDKNKVLDQAQLFQTQDEKHRLQQVLTYPAVM